MTEDQFYLAEWRKYAGLRQHQLGKLMGVTGAQISRIETGKRDFDGRYLRRFKEAINAYIIKQELAGIITAGLRINHYGEALTVDPDPDTLLVELPTVKAALHMACKVVAHEAIERHKRQGNSTRPERPS
jgi:transcriptional regulator with XRE-family HTH domain